MKTQEPILRHDRPRVQTTKQFIPRNDAVPGEVYIFQDATGLCKIGLSRNALERKRCLEKTYGKLTVIAIVQTINMSRVEKTLHHIYRLKQRPRLPHQDGFTEWFQVDLVEARQLLYSVASSVNLAGTTNSRHESLKHEKLRLQVKRKKTPQTWSFLNYSFYSFIGRRYWVYAITGLLAIGFLSLITSIF